MSKDYIGTPPLPREAVMQALATVNDPELHRDIVSLGMVKSVEIENGRVQLTLELTTPACPLKEVFTRDIRAALGKIPGFRAVRIEFTANVSQREIGRDDLAPGVRNIIAVASGKGGVGKSTVSVGLAIALARAGARVGLLDADMYGPNIPLMMGINDPPRVENGKMKPLENYGVKVISIGFLIEPGAPVIWRGPMLNSALRQFFSDVDWGELDYLVVDLPPGTGDVQLSLVQLVPVTGAVLVTTPQEVSLQDARRGASMFMQTKTPILGVIENMAYFRCDACNKEHYIFGEGGGRRVAGELGVPLLGRIPLGQNVREGGDSGRPVLIDDPECEQSRTIAEIAASLAAAIAVRNKSVK
ncbi:Mrp/NBP35 family ATP-binding protein [bacterium]|nr:Mrp/NBP35 family ATP-binding protein [bacterium]